MKLLDVFSLKRDVKNNNTAYAVDDFESIIQLAKDVIANTTVYQQHPIFDVVKILAQKSLALRLVSLISSRADFGEVDGFRYSSLLFRNSCKVKGKCINEYIWGNPIESVTDINLSCDTVLPWAWSKGRLINSLTKIGEKKPWGEWQQMPVNHRVVLWLPMGLVWVHSGNHSISTGIIEGVGKISCEAILDISELYDYIYFDGAYFRSKEDNAIIQECLNFEFSCIFEIGRLIKNAGINYKNLQVY